MEVKSFSDIAEEFEKRVWRMVWCTAATVDRKGRPRSRILHPIWEGSTGWIATGRQSLKAKHLAAVPYISLTYWTPEHQQVYAECATAWEDDPGEKKRIWELYKSTPPPLGYDPGMIWKEGPEDPTYGVLKLTPWRIEISSIMDMMSGKEPQVWRP
jgi:general stress protein 26